MNPLFHCPIAEVKTPGRVALASILFAGLAFAAPPAPAPSTAVVAHSSTTGAFKVAILPFTGDEIGAGMLNSVTKRFQSELEDTRSYEIVKRRKLNKFLASRDPEAGPCQTNECFQELANQFGVQAVFTGVVSKGSETWRLQVKQTEISTGQTTFNHLVEVFGSNNGSLSYNCEEMAKIASGLKIPESNYTVLDRSGRSVWPWVVGGVLVAGGATTAAVLLMNDDGSPGPTKPGPTSSTPDQLIVTW